MALPASLKPIQPFLSVSKQFTKRDPIVSYYCQLYAVQQGIQLGKGDEGAKAALLTIMDDLQSMKRQLKDEEAIKDEEIAQAHIEEVAFKMFDFADNEDRKGNFHKNMIKAFFTVSQLFTILNQFGEQSSEIQSKRKYSKWKAIEIDRCLKNGIAPTPGPPGGLEDEEETQEGEPDLPHPPPYGFNLPGQPHPPPNPDSLPYPPGPNDSAPLKPTPAPRRNLPPPNPAPSLPPTQYPSFNPTPTNPPQPTGSIPLVTNPSHPTGSLPTSGIAELSGVDRDKVQKYCKYAISCLDFNDTPGAIDFLEKSLRLLRTGKED